MVKIICSDLVKRQVPGSSFSHSDIFSFEEIEQLTTEAFEKGNYRKGPREGVFLVVLEPYGFVSGIVKLDRKTKIFSQYKERKIGEIPYIQQSAIGKRLDPEHVDIVIYSRDTLAENNENTDITADFEIVSINVAIKGGVPMDPYTMARNQLNLQGGTYTDYSSETWANSVYFWNNHAMTLPSKSYIKKLLRTFCLNGFALVGFGCVICQLFWHFL